MEKASLAFCPGHISGYFRAVQGDTPEETGSMGAGIVINTGVTARVSRSSTTNVDIFRTGTGGEVMQVLSGSPPVEYLLKSLGVTAAVTTRCDLPISAGYGLSAAALTATALAANHEFSLGLSQEDCSGLAHIAEVIHRTGLGDVAACQDGGIDCRKGPGIRADISRLRGPFPDIYSITFGPLPSPAILGSPGMIGKINAAFPGDCPRSIHEFFKFSRYFSEKSGLITPEVRHALDYCDTHGILASMTMLGNGVFAAGHGAKEVLSGFGTVYTLAVAGRGPYLLNGIDGEMG